MKIYKILQNFIENIGEFRRFLSIPREKKALIFYTEDNGYWVHFESIILQLQKNYHYQPIILTSCKIQKAQLKQKFGLDSFFIGLGTIRTIFFSTLDVDTCVMSMPDLGTFYIKRSKNNVKYVYLHHSLVSSHMVYRNGAFDNFDTILCAGTHHFEEIREREKLFELPTKELVQVGFPKLDSIIKKKKNFKSRIKKESEINVLLAPTWGECSILNTCGKKLINHLLSNNFHVTLRPHSKTIREEQLILEHLNSAFGDSSNFIIETSSDICDTFFSADIMISDWSGVALEFSFGLNKPVIFIDVPKKVLNKDYHKQKCKPLEDAIRYKIGDVMQIKDLGKTASQIRKLYQNKGHRNQIEEIANNIVYNIGKSELIAANYFSKLI